MSAVDRLAATLVQLRAAGAQFGEIACVVHGYDEFQTLAMFNGTVPIRETRSTGDYEHFGFVVDGVRFRVLCPIERVLRVVKQ